MKLRGLFTAKYKSEMNVKTWTPLPGKVIVYFDDRPVLELPLDSVPDFSRRTYEEDVSDLIAETIADFFSDLQRRARNEQLGGQSDT